MFDTGKFVVSLDFELMWGVRDIQDKASYGENIIGVRDALPRMVDCFEQHNVRGTFATVGFLFAKNKEELIQYCPKVVPNYDLKKYSPYNGHFNTIGENEVEDPYHFCYSLIELLHNNPNQELSTHTFSHYYCLELGQTKDEFKSDIEAAIKIAKDKDIEVKSLIFPRNQFNDEYLEVIRDFNIESYRGNEKIWFYGASNTDKQNLLRRFLRIVDTYINISGHNCYSLDDITRNKPYDIPSSRFLRPYSSKLKFLESIRLNRILKSMEHAAKYRKIYHLWWHPHNFGKNIDENLNFLLKILQHYTFLNKKYGFESLTMSELANRLNVINEKK